MLPRRSVNELIQVNRLGETQGHSPSATEEGARCVTPQSHKREPRGHTYTSQRNLDFKLVPSFTGWDKLFHFAKPQFIWL